MARGEKKEAPKETVIRFLPCVLTEQEKQERRKLVCELLAQKDVLDEERAEAMEDFKGRAKTLEKQISINTGEANSGSAMKEVECIVDISGGWKRVIRTDTNETVECVETKQTAMF